MLTGIGIIEMRGLVSIRIPTYVSAVLWCHATRVWLRGRGSKARPCDGGCGAAMSQTLLDVAVG